MDEIDYFREWKVRKALTQPILVLGTEKPLLILNITLCACIVMASRFTWPAFFVLPLFVILHGICITVSKSDPRAISIFKRSTRYSQGYYPPVKSIHCRKTIRKFSSFPEEIKRT